MRLGRDGVPQHLRDGAGRARRLAALPGLVERVVLRSDASRRHRGLSPMKRLLLGRRASRLASPRSRRKTSSSRTPNLVAEGLPAIPMETMRKVAPYNDFRASKLFSWHPIRREMLVGQRLKNTQQVHRVAEPGTPLEPLTDFRDTVASAAYQPAVGDYFIFPRGEGGNETYRIYRCDVANKTVTPFTPDGERAGKVRCSRARATAWPTPPSRWTGTIPTRWCGPRSTSSTRSSRNATRSSPRWILRWCRRFSPTAGSPSRFG